MAARKTKKDIRTHRENQLAQILDVEHKLKENISEISLSKNKQLPLLKSVCTGLYEELDKLCKKAPAETMTDLSLEQVNDIIKEAKELAKSDPFVQRLNVFIAAGDNPQYRDVVIILRQLLEGLNRSGNEFDSQKQIFREYLIEAQGVVLALQMFIEHEEEAEEEYFDEATLLGSKGWFVYDDDEGCFNYDKLDGLDIKKYFEVK